MSYHDEFRDITGSDDIVVYAVIYGEGILAIREDPEEALDVLRDEVGTSGKVVALTAIVVDMETLWTIKHDEEER